MLEIKELYSGYGRTEILHGASLVLEKGSLTSIIGANGCGKSTLLKAILGIAQRTKGSILADGEDVSKMSQRELARRVAYLSQGRSIPDMTVEQLVLHGRFPHIGYPKRYTEKDRRIALEAMERTGIAELSEKPLASLSGGMRQKAYIAMALSQDTDYILLDEPTTYLDIANQMKLAKLLRRLSEDGKGVAAVIHDLPLAMSLSDKVAVMADGKILALGSPSEIYASGIIETVFGVSLRCENGEYSYSFTQCK